MANYQTRATAKWQEKAGYSVKSFKVKAEIGERFREACEKRGESQAAVISRLMEQYISEN